MAKLPIVDEFTDVQEVRRSAHILLTAVLILLGLGSVMVFSASGSARAERVLAYEEKHSEQAPKTSDERLAAWHEASLRPLFGHLSKVALGLALLVLASCIDFRRWSRWSVPLYAFSVLLLLVVLVPGLGLDVKGARRWLDPSLIGFAFQPSEFAKLAIVVLLAARISRGPEAVVGKSFFRGFLPLALLVAVPAGLIMIETDFGTSLLVAFLGLSLVLLAGGRIVHLLYLAVASSPAIFWVLKDRGSYVMARLQGFQAPAPDSQLGFAMSAVQVGGVDGVGLGASRHKLFYLAEIEDDFVLALIGEELGFLGISAVLALFALVFWSGARILLGIRNRFGFFLVAGVLLIIATQALINLTVATGLVPVKGMPLPFVSAGGSSIAVLCLGVGLTLSVARHPDRPSIHLGRGGGVV